MESQNTTGSEAPKLTLDDVNEIFYCLKNVLLPAETEGMAYAISKNIAICERVIKRKTKELDILNQKYCFKDADQKPILYAYEPKGTNPYLFNEQGEYVIVDQNKKSTMPCATRTDLTNPDYMHESQKLREDIDVKFHKFDSKIVKDNFEKGNFDKLNLGCLFGVLIDMEAE